MKTQHAVPFFILVLLSSLLSSAHAEVRALSNAELEASTHIYRGRITKIQWVNKPSSGCVSLVKKATVTLQLGENYGKRVAKSVRVTGFVNVLNSCPGTTGNWELEHLKVGDNVAIYGEKSVADSLVSIRRPNGLSILVLTE
jgi:hypothetical protein